MAQTHADGALVDASRIVGRSVDRVDNPYAAVAHVGYVALLANEPAIGNQFRQPSAQEILYGNV